MRLVLRNGLRLVAAGITAGGVGAFLLSKLMSGLLFEVGPGDPATFALVSVLLTSVALVASAIPGLRATRVDPVIALKAE
jgi:putative ABC transport system permease protein